MYDLIIGIRTLSEWKTIINFYDETVTINQVKLQIESLEYLSNRKKANNFYQDAIGPSISLVVINQVTQILDDKYEKANFPKVVDDNCGHLNVQQRNDLP